MVKLSLDWHGDMKFSNSEGSPAIQLHSSTPGVASPPQALAYGVMACMADCSVRFISNTIDCGNYGAAPNRNYGIWGALGTINGGESIGDF